MANAKKHYLYYPDDKDIPVYLAYGFRPIFLLLAPYIVISMLLWALVYAGFFNPFGENMLYWHIYEFLYGVGVAGIMAFLFTGVPELFPGVVPIVGNRLRAFILLWILGRVSFWFIEVLPIFIVAIINISLLIALICWAFKPVVLDRLQRHASLGYTLVLLLLVEIWFFASIAGVGNISTLDILKVALGCFMVLLLLALRRVNMEVINEIIEDEGLDDEFFAKPFRYNLAIFLISIFTVAEFFYPLNSASGWIALGAGAAILGILNDYNLKFERIIFKPYTIYMGLIFILMACGYFGMGVDILYFNATYQSHFRHFLTSGAFGLAFLMVMVIVTLIHTGRTLSNSYALGVSVILIIIATIFRVSVPFVDNPALFYTLGAVLWTMPFAIYYVKFAKYLLQKRADGIAG